MRRCIPLAFVTLLVACQGTPDLAVTSPSPSAGRTTAAATSPAPAPTVTTAATPTEAVPMNWVRMPSIPTPRSEVAAAVFANTIFVIGGMGGGNVVERYVIASRSWKREVDLPIALDHAMAAAIQGGDGFGVYVFGGNTASGPSARVFHLPPSADRWEELAPMPAARAAGAAVAIGRRIYIVGGSIGPTALHSSVYAYDLDTKGWLIGSDIPTPRDHVAAVALGGRVCAVGGRTLSLGKELDALECFDPVRNAWEKLPKIPTARGGHGAAVVGDRVVVVGGERPGGTIKEVEIYDQKARIWSRYLDLEVPRHGLGVVGVGNTIYAIAGGPAPGASQTAVGETLTLR